MSFYNDSVPAGKTVELTADAPSAEVELSTAQQGGVVTASVADAVTGKPVNGATVKLWRISNPGLTYSTSAMKTDIVIPVNEKVGLVVTAPGYDDWYYPGKGIAADAAPLILKSGEAVTIDVLLSPKQQ